MLNRIGASLGAILAALGLLCAMPSAAELQVCGDISCRTQTIKPSITAPAIPAGSDASNSISDSGNDQHYVVIPDGPLSRTLVLFLPGSTASPLDYTEFGAQAAAAGHGYVGLAYPANIVLGADYPLPGLSGCPGQPDPDGCYTQTRGEINFGDGVHYAPSMASYSSALLTSQKSNVSAGNSVVHRLVCLLDYLAHAPADDNNPDPSYWSQFLVTGKLASTSPYLLPSSGYTQPAYPAWQRIVLVGHSQGGGNAAFLAMNLPVALHRVVLLSSPQDYVNEAGTARPARWISSRSRTPLHRYVGLCNGSTPGSTSLAGGDSSCANEGDYGDQVTHNWAALGGIGLGGRLQTPQPAGDGSAGIPPGQLRGQHQLYLSAPYLPVSFKEHSATAADNTALPAIYPLWRDLLDRGD